MLQVVTKKIYVAGQKESRKRQFTGGQEESKLPPCALLCLLHSCGCNIMQVAPQKLPLRLYLTAQILRSMLYFNKFTSKQSNHGHENQKTFLLQWQRENELIKLLMYNNQ